MQAPCRPSFLPCSADERPPTESLGEPSSLTRPQEYCPGPSLIPRAHRHLPEIGMSAPPDPVSQRLERTRRPILPRSVRTERRGERIAQLGQRAAEDLARRFELRELVDEREQAGPRLRVESRGPRPRVLGPAVRHARSPTPR